MPPFCHHYRKNRWIAFPAWRSFASEYGLRLKPSSGSPLLPVDYRIQNPCRGKPIREPGLSHHFSEKHSYVNTFEKPCQGQSAKKETQRRLIAAACTRRRACSIGRPGSASWGFGFAGRRGTWPDGTRGRPASQKPAYCPYPEQVRRGTVRGPEPAAGWNDYTEATDKLQTLWQQHIRHRAPSKPVSPAFCVSTNALAAGIAANQHILPSARLESDCTRAAGPDATRNLLLWPSGLCIIPIVAADAYSQ